MYSKLNYSECIFSGIFFYDLWRDDVFLSCDDKETFVIWDKVKHVPRKRTKLFIGNEHLRATLSRVELSRDEVGLSKNVPSKLADRSFE